MIRSYITYSRELNAAATRRDSARRASGEAGDYYRERRRDIPHTDISPARCPSGGGEAVRWATDAKIPEFVSFGDHIFAFDLKHIAERCGVNVAASVDALCRPCEVCGLNTYGGGVCRQCESAEEYMSVAEMDADSAGYPGYGARIGRLPGDNGRGLSDEELVF